MAAEKSDILEREIYIQARAETIFAFFIDPEKLIRWKGLQATLDPQPGGLYRVDINGQDVARGEYVEVTPYTRVVFTWGWEGAHSPLPPGASTVEITLTPAGAGTRVRLRHLGLPTLEARQSHAIGWDYFLPRLIASLEGRALDPGLDPMAPAR